MTETKPILNPEIYDFTESELTQWLTQEAGSSNQNIFGGTFTGGWKLQQVPAEYAKLLLFLKSQNIKNYLALGIGNGGSFALECFFMKQSLEIAIAVDSLAYGELINQNKDEILEFIEIIKPNLNKKCQVSFIKKTTNEFFIQLDFMRKNYLLFFSDKFDAIFIDASHEYADAARDFANAQNHIHPDSIIIFHDINSHACPGIVKLWKEIKNQVPGQCIEFINSNVCGIGIVKY